MDKEIKVNENTKKTVEEIETLEKIKKALQEDIRKLQMAKNNVEAQSHTAELHNEQEEKLKHQEKMTQYAIEDRKLEQKRLSVESRMDMAELLEQKNAQRTLEIEKREMRMLELEDEAFKLNQQRSNFEAYKVGVLKELEDAHQIINSAKSAWEEINIEKDRLKGVAIATEGKEKYWNDLIGKLEEDKKQFEIEKENFLGLKAGENKKEEVK